MSTTQPIDPHHTAPPIHPPAVPTVTTADGRDSEQSAFDSQLIEQTEHQIQRLVQEISQLAQSDVSLEEFFDGFLNRVVSALAAVGGAIWALQEDGRVKLQYQINLRGTQPNDSDENQARHGLLLRKVITSGQPMLVPPQSGPAGDGEAGNPTDFLLILATLNIAQDVQGIVEIRQRPGGGPTTQRGYLRFLVQMCDIASGYLKNRRLRNYSNRQALWVRLEEFIRLVHRSLDPLQTAYTIANEARRLIGCDRVSVATRRGKTCCVEAISGQSTIDRRASLVRRLAELAGAVVAAGEAVWYTGNSDDMAPQIEEALHAYLDESHAKTVAVVPLRPPDEDAAAGPSQPSAGAIGALIVEQIEDNHPREGFSNRVAVVADHSGVALANALTHHNLFLMPLWRTLGHAKWIVQAKTLPKTVAVAAAAVLVVLALVLVPADFQLAGVGTLEPKLRREIFARSAGVVIDVPVKHGQLVEPNQLLARLRNTDLEFSIAGLIGQQNDALEQMQSIRRALHGESSQSAARYDTKAKGQLFGQLSKLEKTVESLQQQLNLYRRKEKQLVSKSPIGGQVVTWQVRDQLIQRPVQKGDLLMTVVDPSGDWELEIHMSERRMGHIARARRAIQEDLEVTFVLATHPGEQFVGRMDRIQTGAEVRPDEGNVVLLRVAIDKGKLPDLRPGATVTAKVHCGHRSFGYVWLHDLISFVQSKILFWL